VLTDVERAAELTLDYISGWLNVDICADVLLKCLSGLASIHLPRLRAAIQFKHHLVLIFQQLKNKLKSPASAVSAQVIESVPVFATWQEMERECDENLKRVMYKFITWKQITLAHELFNLYKNKDDTFEAVTGAPTLQPMAAIQNGALSAAPSAASGSASASPSLSGSAPSGAGSGAVDSKAILADQTARLKHAAAMRKEVETILAFQLESAFLADLLAPGASTKNRILAMRRLQAMPNEKVYPVCKGLIRQLDEPQSRYIITQFLHKFLEKNRDRSNVDGAILVSAGFNELKAGVAAAAADFKYNGGGGGGGGRGRVYPCLSEAESEWFHTIELATRVSADVQHFKAVVAVAGAVG
jgi:hypothetical protein